MAKISKNAENDCNLMTKKRVYTNPPKNSLSCQSFKENGYENHRKH